MPDEIKKANHVSFGFIVFSFCFLIPLAICAMIGFNYYSEHLLKMKCLENNKTYVNSICLDITPIKGG